LWPTKKEINFLTNIIITERDRKMEKKHEKGKCPSYSTSG
jgi:hypothetical protein